MSFWSTATTRGSEPSLSFSYVSNSNQVCQSSIAGTAAEMFGPQAWPSSDADPVEWNDKDVQTAHGDDGFGSGSVENASRTMTASAGDAVGQGNRKTRTQKLKERRETPGSRNTTRPSPTLCRYTSSPERHEQLMLRFAGTSMSGR
jgi:hypothetical protein